MMVVMALEHSMDIKRRIAYTTSYFTGGSYGSIRSTLQCMKFLMLTILWNYNESMVTSGFKYKLVNEELTAPQMICFSGLPPPSSGGGGGGGSSSISSTNRANKKKTRYSVSANPCPDFTSRHDLESYDAVVLDMAAYVEVKLVDISMYHTKVDVVGWSTEMQQQHHHQHRLQLYLVSIDDLIEKIDNRASSTPIHYDHQCCFQTRGITNVSIPHFCKPKPTKEGALIYDYRVHAPRITGPAGGVSSPITTQAHSLFNDSLPLKELLTPPNETSSYDGDISSTNVVIDFIVRLKPQRRGRHVVILSNCASDVSTIPTSTTTGSNISSSSSSSLVIETPLTAFIRDIDVHFAFRFGELPLSLMGIIPFYGILAACYAAMSLAWLLRSSSPSHSSNYSSTNNCCFNLIKTSFCLPSWLRKKKYSKAHNNNHHPTLPLLGLQKAIRTLVFAQTVFCTIAFTYYLHLNWIADSVDINKLYSGSAAALVHVWDPFSLLLATCHFGTILLAQCVVTLATDGTWLIQHNIRAPTKRVLKTLCAIWILYFALYSTMTTRQRTVIFGLFLAFWISCLLWNIHGSLRHLKAVMIGQSNDQILAVGGALVAKRSIYRKMYCIVLMYPIIFVASFIWTSCSKKDSWAWVGYVLGDLYLFIIIAHASYVWMPRPMGSHEYVKYAPLELLEVNGLELWEEDLTADDYFDE